MSSKDSVNSFGARDTLKVGDNSYEIYRLDAVPGTEKLPYSLKVLAENLLRTEDGTNITKDHIEAIANWDPEADPSVEIQFTPARVIMQDFTGVPCIVDLATMREAVGDLGGDPEKVNPLAPADLVIDHSVIADLFGTANAFERNVEIEYERNGERYQFLRWGQGAFNDFKVVPPGTGIVHQVNIEYLASVVMERDGVAYPDTCVGTDSHTTMENGLGVLGWGVGGIEAEAAMLGQPVSMLIPRVVGFKLSGERPAGRHRHRRGAHRHRDAAQARRGRKVRRVLRRGRGRGAAGQPRHAGQHEPRIRLHRSDFPDRRGHHRLPADDRAQRGAARAGRGVRQGTGHVARPQAGAEVLRVHRAGPLRCCRVHRRAQASAGPDRADRRKDAPSARTFTTTSATSTRRRLTPSSMRRSRRRSRPATRPRAWRSPTTTPSCRRRLSAPNGRPTNPVEVKSDERGEFILDHGAVVIAAITSCTNTSNPEVMLGAALLAKNAVEKGLTSKPWVKTTMAPGSQVVTDYYDKAGLWPYLEKLGFYLVGYGCTTCIGNSGPLPEEISKAVNDADLSVTAVLSGNRNFEGRINPDVKMNYLASPPLVIAYALAGTMDFDFENEPLGKDNDDNEVFLKDIWPSQKDISDTIASAINTEMFTKNYADVFKGDDRWRNLPTPSAATPSSGTPIRRTCASPRTSTGCPPSRSR